jgi:cell division cycle 2-like protein
LDVGLIGEERVVMASKGKSRWVETEEDAELAARQKKEKEEKKRLKAEKARKQQEALEAQKAKEAAAAIQDDGGDGRPAKRRRLSQEASAANGTDEAALNAAPRLLRFNGGGFGKCRSVENYDKLNDIEEGAYGWVARAKELATGKIVALKRLKIDPKDRSGLPVTGLREIQILRDCDHRNVVKLKEVVVGEDTRKIEKYVSLPFPYSALPRRHPTD